MESFSLLKYWKPPTAPTPAPPSAAVPQNDIQSDDDEDDDDGPFFDLEFAVPDEEEPQNDAENQNDDAEEGDDDEEEEESDREFNFTLSPSPSHNLFFNSPEPNSKPHLTASLLKSATKFRVFMLGLKKPKPNNAQPNISADSSSASNPQQQPKKKLFTVKFKFKVEESPTASLFTRDNTSKAGKPSQNADESQSQSQSQSQAHSSSDEKRSMHKYLKMVNTLYVRVSRKYAEKLRLSEQHNVVSSTESGKDARPPPKLSPVAEKPSMEGDGSETVGNDAKREKQGNTIPLPAGLRVVCKHLGKSRSASSAAAAAEEGVVCSRRRDDSLLQQHDGIQSAILHCKRSFNASSNPRECLSSQLPPCVKDPLHEVSP